MAERIKAAEQGQPRGPAQAQARGKHMNPYECQANLLRAIAHPMRLQILQALAHEPACVCDLMLLIKRRQPYVSQQLMVLRDAGLVVGVREGVSMFYRLAHPELKTLLDALPPLCQAHHASSVCLTAVQQTVDLENAVVT